MHKLIHIDKQGNLRKDLPLSEISELIGIEGNLVWLDILHPTEDDYLMLQEEFGFHPLAIEDTRSEEQRPKLDDYKDYLFIISKYAFRNEDEIGATFLSIFVGPRYLVTVHQKRISAVENVIARWERYGEMRAEGVAYLLYALLDSILQGYFPLLDEIDDMMDDIEDRVLSGQGHDIMDDIFKTKKKMLVLRRTISPLRDVVMSLIRTEESFLSSKSRIYFSDVYDHIIHITDTLDLHRDLASGAMDAYLSTISNRLNDIMKVLTSMATILGALTLISSVYGMNFRYMPELRWHYGYFYLLGFMAVVAVVLAYYFRRKEWL
ncbi:MAG: magnesium/cobalt transporter CorA [bacterium]|jgi:magnesium transporter|nr:magnesium/cobalt transporter CorA [bacterium]MDD3805712.1 magnesium/cobalt transporter CorA [bacterium]MDD4153669.1 magnesium/cobalt transporter CorA [bacterium]MDD4557643.1 magnesium/cobalt transporter CorA [bacterium]